MDGYIKWIRDRVGSQKILVVFTSVCVVDEQGRVLWQRRGDSGGWGLPGGVLELDEDLATCAVREVKEETGLDVAITGLIGVYSSPEFDVVYPNGDETQQVTYCFRAVATGGELRVDGAETLALQWHDGGEIPNTTPWYRQMAADERAGGDYATFASGNPGAARSDEPYFKLIRRYIGQDPFVAPAALGAVFDDDGRLLLVRRADDGTWSLPGGMVELGERIDQTVVNELREETGLDVEAERLIGVYSSADYVVRFPHGDVVKAVSCLFRCRVVGGEMRPDQDEVLEARFFETDQLPELPARYQHRVDDALANIGNTVIS